MEAYLIIETVIALALIGISTYFALSYKKAKKNYNSLNIEMIKLEEELKKSTKHRAILKTTVKTLVENSSDQKKKISLLQVKLKTTEEKLDAIKKFITDMKES
jgi:septal ring factor EnvC (AmiA/AmiB activator)